MQSLSEPADNLFIQLITHFRDKMEKHKNIYGDL